MASIGITTSMHRACNSQHVTKRQPTQSRPARSSGTMQATNVVTPNIEGLQLSSEKKENTPFLTSESSEGIEDKIQPSNNPVEPAYPKFSDERWRKGTWDLTMFVKQGRMDWDALISAEARRRKFLEVYPEASTNEEPVLFRTSIIPWWAWVTHSHLPEAERLNGRAAMVGFFMAYLVDALTGLNVVGQTGNFICKAALLLTIVGVLVVRKKEDIDNIQKLTEEATFYDKQWQASWQDSNVGNEKK